MLLVVFLVGCFVELSREAFVTVSYDDDNCQGRVVSGRFSLREEEACLEYNGDKFAYSCSGNAMFPYLNQTFVDGCVIGYDSKVFLDSSSVKAFNKTCDMIDSLRGYCGSTDEVLDWIRDLEDPDYEYFLFDNHSSNHLGVSELRPVDYTNDGREFHVDYEHERVECSLNETTVVYDIGYDGKSYNWAIRRGGLFPFFLASDVVAVDKDIFLPFADEKVVTEYNSSDIRTYREFDRAVTYDVIDSKFGPREIDGEFRVLSSKNIPASAYYPVIFRHTVLYRPYEEVIKVENTIPYQQSCEDDSESESPSCGWEYVGETKITDSQGFCCNKEMEDMGPPNPWWRGEDDPLDEQSDQLNSFSTAHCLRGDELGYMDGYEVPGRIIPLFETFVSVRYDDNEVNFTLTNLVPMYATGFDQEYPIDGFFKNKLVAYLELEDLSRISPDLTNKVFYRGDASNQTFIIDSTKTSIMGECDKIGVSYTSFRNNQGDDVCNSTVRGDCLKNQLYDYEQSNEGVVETMYGESLSFVPGAVDSLEYNFAGVVEEYVVRVEVDESIFKYKSLDDEDDDEPPPPRIDDEDGDELSSGELVAIIIGSVVGGFLLFTCVGFTCLVLVVIFAIAVFVALGGTSSPFVVKLAGKVGIKLGEKGVQAAKNISADITAEEDEDNHLFNEQNEMIKGQKKRSKTDDDNTVLELEDVEEEVDEEKVSSSSSMSSSSSSESDSDILSSINAELGLSQK